LFAAIGYNYGGSGGSFNLPNLQNIVPVGRGSGTFGSLNATGGAETHTLTVDQMPSHTHIQDSHNHGQDAHAHGASSGSAGSHSHTASSGLRSLTTNLGGGHGHTTVGIQSRVQVNRASGTVATFAASGQVDMASSFRAAHDHDIDSHSHTVTVNAGGDHSHTVSVDGATATNQATTATNQNTGGGAAHNNLQPYIVVNYIIKT
jgi:microcystin-dependent protein